MDQRKLKIKKRKKENYNNLKKFLTFSRKDVRLGLIKEIFWPLHILLTQIILNFGH